MRNPRAELVLGLSVVLTVLGFWGSSAEGQGSLLASWAKDYVEEKATSVSVSRPTSNLQMADINSFFAGNEGYGSDRTPSPTQAASTVQESAIVALAPPDSDYISQLAARHSDVIEYTVQEGDLLSFIASDFGVSQHSIMWANSLKDADSISPGQVLRIPPVSGVIYVTKSGDTAASLAKKFSSSEDQIIAFNHLPKDGAVRSGEQIIIPDGHPAAAAYAQSPPSGLNGNLSLAAIDQKIRKVGMYTKAASALAALKFAYLPDLGDFFRNPTSGFIWGIIHDRNGVDEANSCGTPIYAAADGTVTVADASGWNGGFGKYVKIAHQNGTETLYGHASKLLVSIGQEVEKGQKIALMGSTGQSTGCHLHFEVHGARNPLAKY